MTRTPKALTAALICAAVPVQAEAPAFSLPLDCTLGDTCYIQQYVDHDPGAGAHDFTCAPLSYEGHKGTDFALPSRAAMERGVGVIAAAPGRVTATRDGMIDRLFEDAHTEDMDGRDCGNGLLIDHGDGWTTQYCHMAQGSVRVRKGDDVERGAPLGQVGLSGRTQFPHLHVTIRHNKEVVDPFDPDGQITCGSPSETSLWDTPVAYVPGGLLSLGFASGVPSFEAVKAGTANETITPETGALVLWAYAFGGRRGDVMTLTLTGPFGQIVSNDAVLEKTQAQFFRAAGRRLKADRWPPGAYTGTATLTRGGVSLGSRTVTFDLK